MGLADIAFPLRLSLQVALLATAGCALVGIPVAYLLATREFRGKAVADVLVMLPLVLPPVVTGYYLLLIVGKRGLLGEVTKALTGTAYGITFTWQAAVIASFAISLPLAVTAARSAIAAGLALAFARALGEFGATIMVAGNIPGRTNTMALQIYNAVLYGDWHSATALVAVFTLVSAAFLLLANRLTRAVAR